MTDAQIRLLQVEAQNMYRAHVQRAGELHAMDADYAGPTYCPYVQDWADCVAMIAEYLQWRRRPDGAVIAHAYERMIVKRFERAREHPLSFLLYVDPFQTETPCWVH